MNTKGYFGIGCFNMKNETNYGTLFRTAHLFGADFIFLIGKRFKRLPGDTTNASKHLTLIEFEIFEQFYDFIPHWSTLVGIEISEKSIPLKEFQHPKNVIYLLGAEDIGLSPEILEKCDSIVQLPGAYSLNVAVAGSIVLYDRIIKSS